MEEKVSSRRYLLDVLEELQRLYPTKASVRHYITTAPSPSSGEMEVFIRVFDWDCVENVFLDDEDFEKSAHELAGCIKEAIDGCRAAQECDERLPLGYDDTHVVKGYQ